MLKIFLSWIKGERAALCNELDSIYESRRFFDRREVQIAEKLKALDAREINRTLPARAARGW